MLYPIKINETFSDFPSVDDIAVIIYFQGCRHNCPGCQNKELQICEEEKAKTVEEVYTSIINYCKRADTNKVVFSGGDPLYDTNEEQLNDMLCLIDKLETKGFQVCVYTGNTIDRVREIYSQHPNVTKPTYIKCGPYIEDLRVEGAGKTDDSLVLITKNQAFFKKIGNDFTQISKSNILYFN